jgi:hypothetical protein
MAMSIFAFFSSSTFLAASSATFIVAASFSFTVAIFLPLFWWFILIF